MRRSRWHLFVAHYGISHPIPGADSQSNPDLRKITRNLTLDIAIFGWTGQRLLECARFRPFL